MRSYRLPLKISRPLTIRFAVDLKRELKFDDWIVALWLVAVAVESGSESSDDEKKTGSDGDESGVEVSAKCHGRGEDRQAAVYGHTEFVG